MSMNIFIVLKHNQHISTSVRGILQFSQTVFRVWLFALVTSLVPSRHISSSCTCARSLENVSHEDTHQVFMTKLSTFHLGCCRLAIWYIYEFGSVNHGHAPDWFQDSFVVHPHSDHQHLIQGHLVWYSVS